ncbi:MAG: hypothetical protein ACHQJ6_09065 [Candidatus Berkiellales bacterium]
MQGKQPPDDEKWQSSLDELSKLDSTINVKPKEGQTLKDLFIEEFRKVKKTKKDEFKQAIKDAKPYRLPVPKEKELEVIFSEVKTIDVLKNISSRIKSLRKEVDRQVKSRPPLIIASDLSTRGKKTEATKKEEKEKETKSEKKDRRNI